MVAETAAAGADTGGAGADCVRSNLRCCVRFPKSIANWLEPVPAGVDAILDNVSRTVDPTARWAVFVAVSEFPMLF